LTSEALLSAAPLRGDLSSSIINNIGSKGIYTSLMYQAAERKATMEHGYASVSDWQYKNDDEYTHEIE